MMEEKMDCRGDESLGNKTAVFSSEDKMRFSTLTYEIIEELRMRRKLDAENEKKIEKLVGERFALGWKLDQESSKVNGLVERHDTELRETRRQLEEKMRDFQVEASQQQVYRKMAEKEKEALKEEIRKLQLANYSLEKKVRESEHQEKLLANEREQHIRQVSGFESQYRHVDTLIQKLQAKQDQLDKEVKVVQDLNKRLQYVNRHQKCVLDMKEEDLLKLRQKLLETEVKVKVEPDKVKDKEESMQGEITKLKKQIKMFEVDYKSLEDDKDLWKEKYWDSLRKLEESHRLVNVHLHNAASYRDDLAKSENLHRDTKDRLRGTEGMLQTTKELYEKLKEKHDAAERAWSAQMLNKDTTIDELNGNISSITKLKEERDNDMKAANIQIELLETRCTELLKIINVEKQEVECQSDLQMLQMVSRHIQAAPEYSDKITQKETETKMGVTQTIDAALCSTESQTDSIKPADAALCSKAVQTDNTELVDDVDFTTKIKQCSLCDMHTQTDQDFSSKMEETFEGPCCLPVMEDSSQVKKKEHLVSNSEILQEKQEQINVSNQNKSNIESPDDLGLNDRVHVSIQRENILYSDSIQSSYIDQTKAQVMETAEKISVKADDITRVLQYEDMAKKAIEELKDIGIEIPKIDIEQSFVGVIEIDPDEFSVKLTQDAEKTPNCNGDGIIREDGLKLTVAEAKITACGLVNTKKISPVMEKDTIQSAIEKNWDITPKLSQISKTKARKHKLTTDDIEDQFSSFDAKKEKFENFQSKPTVECTAATKLTEVKPQEVQKKPRNFSAMFMVNKTEQKQINYASYQDDMDTELVISTPPSSSGALSERFAKEMRHSTDVATATLSPMYIATPLKKVSEENNTCDKKDGNDYQDLSLQVEDHEEMTDDIELRIDKPPSINTQVIEEGRTGNDQMTSFNPVSQHKEKLGIDQDCETSVDKSVSHVGTSSCAEAVCTAVSSKSCNSLNQGSHVPPTGDAREKPSVHLDLLQKYRDIVAKIKPMQHHTKQIPSISKPAEKEMSKVSPGNKHLPDFRKKSSPRATTPRGILKGSASKDKKSRNVTWNETVMNKNYIADDNNTPEELENTK